MVSTLQMHAIGRDYAIIGNLSVGHCILVWREIWRGMRDYNENVSTTRG
jgi:hypothetical protein